MAEIDVANLRKLIDEAITQWAAGVSPTDSPDTAIVDKPERTDGKRAVRTKSTGDRVYLIDDNAKTKAWVAGTQAKPGPELLKELGFEMTDVVEVEDSTLLGYTMQPSIYQVG